MSALYLDAFGRGRPVVLLHGWGLNGAVWQDLAGVLAREWRVYVPDLPGHGRSAPVPLYDLRETAESLLTVVGDAVWIGWSFGALVAFTAAHSWPQRVRKLVLIGANPRFVQAGDWPDAMPARVFERFACDLERDYHGTLQRFLTLQLGGGPSSRPTLRRLREAVFAHGTPHPQALGAGLRLLADTDLRPALPQMHVSTLVVHGARDTLAPLAAGRRLAEALPDARLIEVSEGGHAPFLSHADAVTRDIHGFLHD